MKKIIAVRKKYKAFSQGNIEFLKPKNNKILAYLREFKGEKILCIVNLAKTAECFSLNFDLPDNCELVEIFGQNSFPSIKDQDYIFMMQPHSFFWFEIKETQS